MIWDLTDPRYYEQVWVLGPPPQWVINRWEARRGAQRESDLF